MAPPERNTTLPKDGSVKTVESTRLTQQINDLQRTDYQLWKKVTDGAKNDSSLKTLGFRDARDVMDFTPDKTRTSTSWQDKRQEAMKSQGDEIKKNGSRKIQQGDTLWDIAHSNLKLTNKDNKPVTNKDIAREVERLAKINKLTNPSKIDSGKEIRMSEKPGDKSSQKEKERTNPTDKFDEKYRRTEKNDDGSEVQFDKHNRMTRFQSSNKLPIDMKYDEKGNVRELDFQKGLVFKRSDDGKYHEYKDGKPTGKVHDFEVKTSKEGDLTFKYKDGSTQVYRRDGTATYADKDGRVTRHFDADGSSTEFSYWNGTRNLQSYTRKDRSGNVFQQTFTEDKETWKTRDKDGKDIGIWKGSIQVRPDGVIEFKGANGGTSVSNRKDGSLSTQKDAAERAAKEKQEQEERERKYAAPF